MVLGMSMDWHEGRDRHVDHYSELKQSFKKLKNGTWSKNINLEIFFYCPLNTCEVCGILRGAKWVSYRNGIYGWNFSGRKYGYPIKTEFDLESKKILCMCCWNKVRAVEIKRAVIDECVSLTNKLKKEIKNARTEKSCIGSEN